MKKRKWKILITYEQRFDDGRESETKSEYLDVSWRKLKTAKKGLREIRLNLGSDQSPINVYLIQDGSKHRFEVAVFWYGYYTTLLKAEIVRNPDSMIFIPD